MEINQLAQMIEWLDEERRRDKAVIATLEERLAQQSDTINTLQSRLKGLESDTTVIRESALPVEKEYDMLETLRREMRQVVETSESRRLTAEREQERRAELNRENTNRVIRDLTEKLEKLERNLATLTETRSEIGRQQDIVTAIQQRIDDLGKKLEEPDRRLAFLEEQRRQDARRISEVETEVPEVKKQIDSIRPKLSLIEDLSIRNERRIQEAQNSERERREQIQQFIDSQSLVIQQHDQQVQDLVKRFGENDREMKANIERFETWSQAYRDMKRIIDDFERIGERLERRINEVAEMQRLSEERFRQEWNDWREDDQKRWKQLTLANDEVWRNHDKEFEQFVRKTQDSEGALRALADHIKRLWNLERERAQLYRERYQSMLLEYDTGSTTDILPDLGSSSSSGTSGNGGNTNGAL